MSRVVDLVDGLDGRSVAGGYAVVGEGCGPDVEGKRCLPWKRREQEYVPNRRCLALMPVAAPLAPFRREAVEAPAKEADEPLTGLAQVSFGADLTAALADHRLCPSAPLGALDAPHHRPDSAVYAERRSPPSTCSMGRLVRAAAAAAPS